MWKKAFLVATIAGALAVGSTAAIAQTPVDATDDVPAIAVQAQLQSRTQIQDPALMGTDDALLTQTQTQQQLQVHDPEEIGIDPLLVQERAELQAGTATQAGDLTQIRDQIQDPELCDGDCDGNGIGDGTGDCDEPINLAAGDGTGNKYGNN